MRAAEIAKGDVLYWQRSKYGSGVKAKVLDPSPVYGKSGRWNPTPAKGHGTGVLVEIDDFNTITRTQRKATRAVPLRQLVGKYEETVKRLKAEGKAEERAREESARAREAHSAAERAAVKRLEALGVHSAYEEHAGHSARVSMSAAAVEALIDALPEGWQMPAEDEE